MVAEAVKNAVQASFEDTPIVLDALSVNVAVPDVLDLVVNHLMGQVPAHAPVGRVAVSHQDSVLGVHVP